MIKILNALQCSTAEFFICRAETGKNNRIPDSSRAIPGRIRGVRSKKQQHDGRPRPRYREAATDGRLTTTVKIENRH